MLTYLRSFRIFQIAIFDVVMTLIGLLIILRFLKPNQPEEFYIAWVTVTALPISVISHLIVNQPTMLNYYLGLSHHPQ